MYFCVQLRIQMCTLSVYVTLLSLQEHKVVILRFLMAIVQRTVTEQYTEHTCVLRVLKHNDSYT
jgi:hypothetical protein